MVFKIAYPPAGPFAKNVHWAFFNARSGFHFQLVMAGLTSASNSEALAKELASNSRPHPALGMEAKYPAFACFGGQSVYCEQPDPEVKRSEAKFLLQGSAQTQPLILAIQIHFSAFQRIFHSLSVVRCRFKV
ncbi:hypothetical protein BTO09_03590 [Gilvibacter sp. SZ-19]|nr:hypothetical protein BTO09_03590 [Gilvibacter sp. SZ-19]